MTWDFIIIGSGFGGSVSALRLAEKGYDVLVLEKGQRFGVDDFPESNWDVRRWSWLPWLGFRGIFKMTLFPHATVVSGYGVGGGSLGYACTLPTPETEYFTAESWNHLADWRSELEPHYQTARRMLGVAENPFLTAADDALRQVAQERGQLEHFHPTNVGIFFGEPGEQVPDPFFNGEGPERAGCIACGGCITGCRHGAKNTLDKNYLYLAEKLGAQVQADTEVTWVRPVAEGGYEVSAVAGASVLPWKRQRKVYKATQVIFAGGVLGTVPLLLRLRESPDGLDRLSDRLGFAVRTNSEVFVAVVSQRRDTDFSEGIAIGSLLHTDRHSHIEPVRFSSGSGLFRLAGVPHVPGRGVFARILRMLAAVVTQPMRVVRAWLVDDWAKRTIIALFMRTVDGTLRLRRRRSWTLRRRITSSLDEGEPPRASVPEATELANQLGAKIDGLPMSLVNETVLDVPTTAHILGGCCFGESAANGVIDTQHRLYGYDGLYVIDGSAVSANPGVNPALSITALAERAMSFIPSKSRSD